MTTQNRDAIWNGLLDVARLDRYYSALATRFQRRHVGFNFFIAISSLGAATILLVEWPQWISALFFLAVAGMVTWTHYAEYSKKATIALMVSKQCRELGISWRELWREQDAPDTSARISELSRQLNEITDVDLDIDEKLNVRCAERRTKFVRLNLQAKKEEVFGSGYPSRPISPPIPPAPTSPQKPAPQPKPIKGK